MQSNLWNKYYDIPKPTDFSFLDVVTPQTSQTPSLRTITSVPPPLFFSIYIWGRFWKNLININRIYTAKKTLDPVKPISKTLIVYIYICRSYIYLRGGGGERYQLEYTYNHYVYIQIKINISTCVDSENLLFLLQFLIQFL